MSLNGRVLDNFRPIYRVTFAVGGLLADRTATLVVSGSDVVLLYTRDSRCDEDGRVLTCTITAPDTRPVDVFAIAPRGGTIEAEVTPAEPDPDLRNNRWSDVFG